MASDKPFIPPRSGAETEMASLLAEIPTWDDHMLTHMYKRFATSRLFRVHHLADGELTDRAQTLLARAGSELAERGLPIPEIPEDPAES